MTQGLSDAGAVPVRLLAVLCWCLALHIPVTEAGLVLHLTAFKAEQKTCLCFRETCLTRQEKTPAIIKTCGLSNLVTLSKLGLMVLPLVTPKRSFTADFIGKDQGKWQIDGTCVSRCFC